MQVVRAIPVRPIINIYGVMCKQPCPIPFFWSGWVTTENWCPGSAAANCDICCNKTDFRSAGIGYLRCFRKTIFWSNVGRNSLRPARGAGCKYSNLIRGFGLERTHRLWAGDITYISLKEGFAYLALITDAYWLWSEYDFGTGRSALCSEDGHRPHSVAKTARVNPSLGQRMPILFERICEIVDR